VTHNLYLSFHQTAAQLRRVGARGGRSSARNRRARRGAAAPAPSQTMAPPLETTAAAITTLDAQFPWLRGADRRLHPPLSRRLGSPTSS
jgi:hypothetical protein